MEINNMATIKKILPFIITIVLIIAIFLSLTAPIYKSVRGNKLDTSYFFNVYEGFNIASKPAYNDNWTYYDQIKTQAQTGGMHYIYKIRTGSMEPYSGEYYTALKEVNYYELMYNLYCLSVTVITLLCVALLIALIGQYYALNDNSAKSDKYKKILYSIMFMIAILLCVICGLVGNYGRLCAHVELISSGIVNSIKVISPAIALAIIIIPTGISVFLKYIKKFKTTENK